MFWLPVKKDKVIGANLYHYNYNDLKQNLKRE